MQPARAAFFWVIGCLGFRRSATTARRQFAAFQIGIVKHPDLAEPLQCAAGTQAGGCLFGAFLQSDLQAVGEEADEKGGFDGAGPAIAITFVVLAEMELGFLNGSATCDPAISHNAPVAMLLAVFEAFVAAQN